MYIHTHTYIYCNIFIIFCIFINFASENIDNISIKKIKHHNIFLQCHLFVRYVFTYHVVFEIYLHTYTHARINVNYLQQQKKNKISDKPSKPEGPVVLKEISRESVTIEWKPPLDDGGLDLIKYAIEKHEPEIDEWVKVAEVNKDIETYCIQKLNENCEYMFRVMAQNPVGISEALESEPIVIKNALGMYFSIQIISFT